MHSTQDARIGLDVGSPNLGFKLGGDPTDVSKQKRTNRISCKGNGNKSGKLTTKTPNVGKDSSPSMGKFKQGTWKTKDGRPVEETLSSCMDIDIGQKCKISFEGPDGTESGLKTGKTIDMLEIIPTAEVARQPRRTQ